MDKDLRLGWEITFTSWKSCHDPNDWLGNSYVWHELFQASKRFS